MLLRVGRLRGDDGVEAGRRNGAELLPHGSDLQQCSKSWRETERLSLAASRPKRPGPEFSSGLTESADGAAVGLVAQRVCAGVAEAQVPAGQDERVPHVRQTHHTLGAVVADLVVGDLRESESLRQHGQAEEDASLPPDARVYL